MIYKYNKKHALLYEDKVVYADNIQNKIITGEAFNYIYKYDKYGNWTERIKYEAVAAKPPLKKHKFPLLATLQFVATR